MEIVGAGGLRNILNTFFSLLNVIYANIKCICTLSMKLIDPISALLLFSIMLLEY